MESSDEVKCENEFTYKGTLFNEYTTVEHLEEIDQFEFLPTDIILSTFPRSGTTFTQEIIWQIKNRKNVSEDEEFEDLMDRFPFIEFNHKLLPKYPISFIEVLNSQKTDPYRLIKTHLPYKCIKESVEKSQPRMIFVMRNAKDCLVSNFYQYSYISNIQWKGTFDDYFKLFTMEKTHTGSYFDNNLEWWRLRHQSNTLIIFYEDLILNIHDNVKRIADFLGETLTTEELDQVIHNSSFPKMVNNPKINIKFGEKRIFIRKGIIGDWKNHLSEEQNNFLEKMISDKFHGTGLQFIYE